LLAQTRYFLWAIDLTAFYSTSRNARTHKNGRLCLFNSKINPRRSIIAVSIASAE
jgi:hypothetical protein